MAKTFAEKFEEAIAARRAIEPGWGLRTLAREIAEHDPEKTKTVLRRLQKYRPKPGRGGAGEVVPTEPTRHEIEAAMGLDRDSLAAERDLAGDLAALARQARQFEAFKALWHEMQAPEPVGLLEGDPR